MDGVGVGGFRGRGGFLFIRWFVYYRFIFIVVLRGGKIVGSIVIE